MFFGLFDSKSDKKDKLVPQYDISTIEVLEQDHRKLLYYLESIEAAMMQGTLGTGVVKNSLKYFRMHLLEHFMEEDIKIYQYMKSYYKYDHSTYKLIESYEESIKVIHKNVVEFFEYYSQDDVPLDDEYREKFKHIFQELVYRISLEEQQLYKLYRP
jgi:hypothetical protein